MSGGRGPIVVQVDAELRPLVPGFLESRKAKLPHYREALEAGDLERLRSLGHSMKGVGAGYGFAKLTDIGRTIEGAAKRGDLDVLREQVEVLEDYMARVEVEYV